MSSLRSLNVSRVSQNEKALRRRPTLPLFATVFLAVCCRASVGLAAADLPTVTSVYVFQSNSSTVYQSGGYDLGPSVSEVYPVEGTFQLLVDTKSKNAWFVAVEATLTETSDALYSQDLDTLFDMTYSDGVLLSDNSVEFTGTMTDGSDSEIVLRLDFNGDVVTLIGETIPPSYDDDYYYELTATAVRKYGGGTGDEFNPYLIGTAEHLNRIGTYPEDWGSHFRMVDNVDLTGYQGTALNVIGDLDAECAASPFTGVFNGNGYSVSHLSYASADTVDFGLFRYVAGPDAEIIDVDLIDPNIDMPNGLGIGALVGCLGEGVLTGCRVNGGRVVGAQAVGALVGRNGRCQAEPCAGEDLCSAGQLVGCRSTAAVAGLSDVGGLVGINNGVVTDCNAAGTVTGQQSVGGLVGTNGNNVVNCQALGTVFGATDAGGLVGTNTGIVCGSHSTASVTGQENVGGLVGDNNGGSVTLSDATATVDGSSIVGGLVGTNAGKLGNSFSSGTVTGDLYVGGLIGRNVWRVSACYSTAAATAQYGHVGGLVGRNESVARIADCYASASVAGPYYAGGLLGSNDGVVMKCYANGPVDGIDDLGGLVGGSTDEACALFSFWDIETSGRLTSAGGLGLLTIQMKAAETFGGWGACTSVALWAVDDSQDYPALVWEGRAGATIAPMQLFDILTGTGTEDDPFVIFTPEELNAVGLFPCEWDKNFQLAADVTMSTYSENQFNPIGYYRLPFTGLFDGAGHTISSLRYSPSGPAYAGLFGCVSSLPARVENLGLVDVTVVAEDTDYVGALAGCLKEGAIVNCYAENASVLGRHLAAGLVGDNQGTLQDCSVSGSIAGEVTVGALVGRNEKGTVVDCSAAGLVAGVSQIGGLVGDNNGTISGGYSESSVSAGDQGGGLVGLNRSSIADAYATGQIMGHESIGGLIGSNRGSITDAHATGQIVGNEKIGGLAGSNQGELVRCYAIGDVTGDASVGGLSGVNLSGGITACHAGGTVYGRLSAGGLVGYSGSEGKLAESYATGSVSGYEWIGGLVGRNEAAVRACYASGRVSGTMDIGGLVGANLAAGSIGNSYASGNASGYEWVGGLVGVNGGSLQACYATGVVVGATEAVGGLAGLDYGNALACFWDIEASGRPTSAAGTGKTTAQMKSRSTFTASGWDFTSETANGTGDLWQITEGQSYPALSWEATAF